MSTKKPEGDTLAPRRPVKGSADDIKPPPPADDKSGSSKGKKYLRIFLAGWTVGILLGFGLSFLRSASEATPATAAEISEVYDHAIILRSREGDTLESAALAVFPNTLIEQRVREDGLSDDAKDLERQRYQAEWQRLSRLLTGTTGTSLAPGEFFAVPAMSGEPGAIEVEQVSREIEDRTEAAAKTAAAGD